jgi:hypothetical protein
VAAIDLLDAALDEYGRRDLLSSAEVIDLLLDLRREVTCPPTPSPSSLS